MLAFPPLVGARGKLFNGDVGTPPDMPIWGDGLVEQSIADFYSPSGGSTACTDEFAFPIPSLVARLRVTNTRPPEAVVYLQRLLVAHIDAAARHLPQLQQHRPRHAPRTIDLIFATGTITTLTAHDVAREAKSARRAFFGPLSPLAEQSRRTCATAPSLQFARERWLFELSVLSCLDHMLVMARRGGKHDHPICIADVFVGSLHASLNAAYLYPEFAYAHELLSLGAWLGYLVRGRAALMPTFVAELLLCELASARKPSSQADATDEIRALLRFYADLAVGSRHLQWQARRTVRSGQAQLVLPRPRGMAAVYIWNKAVHKEIDKRLHRVMRNQGRARDDT